MLCLGRVIPSKGFDLALRAFGKLTDQFPNARLVFAGDGPDRPLLQRKASELGIADAVDFVGWVSPDDVPTILNSATVFVLPSRIEGLPLAADRAREIPPRRPGSG